MFFQVWLLHDTQLAAPDLGEPLARRVPHRPHGQPGTGTCTPSPRPSAGSHQGPQFLTRAPGKPASSPNN